MKPIQITTEFKFEPIYSAFDTGRRWNGFIVPAVDRRTLAKIKQDYKNSEGYDEEEMKVFDNLEMIDGKYILDIGWTWDEYDEEEESEEHNQEYLPILDSYNPITICETCNKVCGAYGCGNEDCKDYDPCGIYEETERDNMIDMLSEM